MIWHNGIMIDRKNRSIEHDYHTEHFPLREKSAREYAPNSRFECLCHLILQPHSRGDLYERIYGDHPEGGPDMGIYIWDVRFQQWKPAIKRLSLQLIRWKRAGIMFFQLVPHVV